MTTSLPSRRLLVAIGMVGAPICLAVGNLLSVDTAGTPAQTVAAIGAHTGQYLAASVIQAAGFALLGAVGVGVAMLLDRRGSALASVGALITLIGGIVMGGAALTTAFVEAALPGAEAVRVLPALMSNSAIGTLFEFSIIAGVGALLSIIALFIGRPVPVWVTVLLLVGVVLSNLGGGPLGAVLGLPFLAAMVLLARALIRVDQRAGTPAAVRRETVTA